jgi:serine-type D-Ala-D-Ala carboxypeptidase (penicillin-binding protein 5/6)
VTLSDRRWPRVVSVVILIVAAAVIVRLITLTPPNLVLRVAFPTTVRLPGSAPQPAWPAAGDAALVVQQIGSLGSAGGDTPRPIASLAKVMTAYLTLKKYPLTRTGGGFTITVTPADARSEVQDAKQDESVVAVRAGERLDERQLLEALLIPSGDNIAQMLAVYDAGSDSRFVAEMNRPGCWGWARRRTPTRAVMRQPRCQTLVTSYAYSSARCGSRCSAGSSRCPA